MNAAYIIAMAAIALALVTGLMGTALATSDDRAERYIGPWVLAAAAAVAVAAFAFAGVGVNIQYYQ